MGNLVIYRASAGTGKTFTLAVEYIKLLILSPSNYRRILAVTFTNKATAEMKERILSQLYGIGHCLPDSEVYYKRISEEVDMGEMFIRNNALEALHNILHDFSFFHVETIDSFFQTVMRHLAHELQLSNNLTIDLDQKTAISDAVDEMMEQLTPGTPEIEWIMEAIADQIDDNRNWNISRPLKEFAKNLFAESYQKHSHRLDTLLTNEFTQTYKKKLKEIRDHATEELRLYHATYEDSLTASGFTTDAFNKKSLNGFTAFFKLIGKGVTDLGEYEKASIRSFLESPDNWPNKTLKGSERERFMALVNDEWFELMTSCWKRLEKLSLTVNTCSLIMRNLNELRLLNVIHSCMNDINQRNNRFLLADTNQLLATLIQENDAPFIFEKLGTQLRHVMIDEFQDTSRMQWGNFRSLLVECLSSAEEDSLIVGDIKQSIYRWRSGDWGILAKMRQERLPGTIIERELDTNRRSLGNIISFNNQLFLRLQQVLTAMGEEEGLDVGQIARAYEHVEEQRMMPQNKDLGHVSITLLNTKNTVEGREAYTQRTLEQLAETIQSLQARQVPFSQIAILLRAKARNVPLVAKYFSQNHPDIPLVSDEAFKLGASRAVRLVVHALQLLLNPADNLALVMVANTYLNEVEKRNISLAQITSLLKAGNEELRQLLPDAFSTQRESLLLLPLYELVERIILLFRVNEIPDQQAYLFTFLDELNLYIKEKPNDIPSFLAYWKENMQEKNIPSGKVDGIRIMSIHASKGLEFNHVLVPFCDFNLTDTGDTLWCEPAEPPYDELPTAPIMFGTSMKDSIFQAEYSEEKLQQWIDNMNLLYVAFTRPKCNLYVWGKLSVTKEKTVAKTNVSGLLFHALEGNAKEVGEDDFVFELGSFCQPQETERKRSANPLLQQPTDQEAAWASTQLKLEFRQSNQSQQYIERQQEEHEDSQQEQYIRQGLLLHRIFSTLHTAADVAPAMKQLEQEGLASKKRMEQLHKLIQRGLANPQIKDWFSDRWKISNECSILTKENGQLVVRRPDRVMVDGEKVVVVDFKFGTPKPEYPLQVQAYMELMRNMGYRQVEGYLWYVYNNKIEKVE